MEPERGFFTELLESGVQVVGQPMEGVQSAAIGFLVGSGARDERSEELGVSHFVEQMLFRGTEHHGARELSERFDALGISHDSSSGLEMTLVTGVMLGDKLPVAIDLLADVVRFPSFPEEDIDNVRALILQEQRQREDQPGHRVMDALRQQLFAGSPASHDILGTEETIGGIGSEQLRRFWYDRYTANNIIISIAGNFLWSDVVEQLRRVTAAWPSGSGRMLMEEPKPQRSVTVFEREMTQEHIGFAFPAVAASDPHYYAVALLSQTLGGSTTSRLFQEVREKRGLAYAVQSRFDGMEKTGLVRIYVGTSAERAHESVDVIVEELRKLERGGITEEELSLSKTRLKSQVVMRSESTAARMSANLRSWWFEQRLYSLEEIRDLIERVTVEEVLNVARNLDITRNLTVVGLGPRSEADIFGGLLAAS